MSETKSQANKRSALNKTSAAVEPHLIQRLLEEKDADKARGWVDCLRNWQIVRRNLGKSQEGRI
jgi:hypothetical protein